LNYSITSLALWPSCRNYPSNRANLSPIAEEVNSSTELLKYSPTANNSLDHQVCMASLRDMEDDELGPEYDNEQLANVSAMSPQLTPPRMRTRSTEGFGG
jgi:hypothetical protein